MPIGKLDQNPLPLLPYFLRRRQRLRNPAKPVVECVPFLLWPKITWQRFVLLPYVVEIELLLVFHFLRQSKTKEQT